MRTTAEQLSAVLDHWQSGTGPLYQQLADAIVSLAESGSLEHGTRLPSERALADNLHLSRNTVTAAYQQLRDDGLARGAARSRADAGLALARDRGPERPGSLLQDPPHGQCGPIVGLSRRCPPPAPVVMDALA